MVKHSKGLWRIAGSGATIFNDEHIVAECEVGWIDDDRLESEGEAMDVEQRANAQYILDLYNGAKAKENELLEILNKMVKVLKPFKLQDINTDLLAVNQEALIELEKEHDEVGLKYIAYDKEKELCSSTIALMATITDILIGKRLAFVIDEGKDGIVTGFTFA